MNGDDIIAKLKEGNEEVLKKIYAEYRVEFFKWSVRKFGCNVDEAKEFYQYAIVEMYENVITGKLVKLNSSLKTYLFAIGKYKMLDYTKRRAICADNFDLTYYLENNGYCTDEISNSAEVEDNLKAVEDGLSKLGQPCKLILEHFYYYKRKSEEIAEIMGYKNSDTVKNLRHKCLKRLRKIFYSNNCISIEK